MVCCALAITAASAPMAHAAGPQSDSSPAMDRTLELLETLNTGGNEAVETWVRGAFNERMLNAVPMEMHLSIFGDAHDRGAPWEIGEVRADADNETHVLLHSPRADEWMSMNLAVEPEAPHLIAGIGFSPASAPPAAPASDVYTDPEIQAEMDSLLDDLAASDRFSGTVLIVRDGEPVYQAMRGEANKDFGVANNMDTKFNLGSMNKMFTAVAVAQLVERGELSYDDTLDKFLPTFPDAESAAKIRIKHLLSHTAGLGSYFNEEFMESARASFRTVEELMTLAEGETMQFEPGTQWSYSNTGFLVLGRVIEVVAGQDYHDYIRENVTGPAGMTSTDAYDLDRVNKNLAVGYDLQDGPDGREWRNNIFMHVIKGGPAGGGYSTVGDLARFAQALRDGTLVSAETLALLTTAKPEIASTRYGYGFGVSEDGSTGHSGGFVGINSQLVFWPAGEWTIAVMSNYSGGAQAVVGRARRLVSDSE